MTTFLCIVGINWLLPLALSYTFVLVMTVVFKDYRFDGSFCSIPCFKLVDKDVEPWHTKLWVDFVGLSLMGVILLRVPPKWKNRADLTSLMTRTKMHERRHVIQLGFLGLLGVLAYILDSIVILACCKEKHAYLDNWFERDARRVAGQQLEFTRFEWPQGPDDRWPWW